MSAAHTTKGDDEVTDPDPRTVLARLAAQNPGACECGHDSSVHGFGSGECWSCAFDDDRPDCDHFEATEGHR